jgi:hypothetical protein
LSTSVLYRNWRDPSFLIVSTELVSATPTGPQAHFPQRRAMTRMGHGGLTAADYADVEHLGEIMDPETGSKKASTWVS